MSYRENTGGRVCMHGVLLGTRCYSCLPHGSVYGDYPQPFVGPSFTPTPSPAFGFRFLPEHCVHCWCRLNDGGAFGGPEHEECCNCGVRRKATDPVT